MKTNWIWQPSPAVKAKANVTAFMKKHQIATPQQLLQNANTGIEWFWDAAVHEVGIDWFEPYSYIVDGSDGFAFAKWFVGGRINIVHNCVDRHALNKKTANKVAHIWQGECGAVVKTTYAQLYEQTNRVAAGLQQMGIGRGDAVALYMPMLPEILPIYFGILKIGAVVVPIFSGFGTEAVLARLNDAKVKVVFTADGTLRRGKPLLLKAMLEESLKGTPSLQRCVVVKRLHLDAVPMQSGRDLFYEDFLAPVGTVTPCEELPSEHPCMIIYTSGTTGKPKGCVHTHVGVLAQVAKEHYFHFDLKPKDVFLWVTDIGWMMGPWEILGTTHFSATVVTLEGAPTYPAVDRVFKLAQKAEVTHLGVSPTLVRVLMKEGERAFSNKSIKTLRLIGSTGEPWDEDSYLWCFKTIGKGKVPIINISGGTEIMGCLLAPLPILPLKACSLQGPALGMAVDIFNEHGQSAPPGEVGYLVCKKPAPSMTKGFLNDSKRYLETYFGKFPKIWNHGDWAVRDADGQWFLRGRSDDTIKVAGKRVGPAEIESCVCDHALVVEACAFGVPDAVKGESVVCFAVLKKGIGGTPFVEREIQNLAAERLGKTLKPERVYFAEHLPKTRSGKIVRAVIRKHYLGETIDDLSSVENPDVLRALARHA